MMHCHYYLLTGPAKAVFDGWKQYAASCYLAHQEWIRSEFGEDKEPMYTPNGLFLLGAVFDEPKEFWHPSGFLHRGKVYQIPDYTSATRKAKDALPYANPKMLSSGWNLPDNLTPGYLLRPDLDIVVVVLPANQPWVGPEGAHKLADSDYWLMSEGKLPSAETLLLNNQIVTEDIES